MIQKHSTSKFATKLKFKIYKPNKNIFSDHKPGLLLYASDSTEHGEISLSLAVGQLKFIDSFQFTPKGLDVLAKTLADDEYLRVSSSTKVSNPT